MPAPAPVSVDARTEYERRRAEAERELAALASRSSAISLARVVTFAAALALALAAKWGPRLGAVGYGGAAASFVAFVVLMIVHDRVLERVRRSEASRAWAEQGLARLDERYARDSLPGELEAPEGHPYAHDLDVVGRGSLLQSLDTTRTAQARSTLSRWLLAPAPVAEILDRQACARDLAPRVRFREELFVEGTIVAEEPPDPAPLLAWAVEEATWSPGPLLQVASIVLPAITLGLLVFGGALPLPRAAWVVTLLVQIAVSTRHRSAVSRAVTAASEHQEGLARFARMFAVVEREPFEAPPLVAMRERLLQGPASHEIARLRRIVGFVDARRNEVFRLLVGPLLMWDLNCALALERWRRRAGRRMPGHLVTLANVEALCSLGARAFERPHDAFPTLVTDHVVLRAEALGHPLLPVARVVRNDVALEGAGTVLLVTGSNMSGKSTLMRAIGTNVVLALAGAPVRATSLTTSPFEVWTSMRIRDSLSEGVSHFFAELKRLKAVCDAADAAVERPVLFLLDEILHGTNSRERHLGARGIVRKLAGRNACGAVSTHDLALAELEREIPGKVRNVHFREHVETVDGAETMTFDYTLRPGVVTSSNALRLMKIVGLDVELPQETP